MSRHTYQSRPARTALHSPDRSSPAEYSDVLICDVCKANERHVAFGEREDVCEKCAPQYDADMAQNVDEVADAFGPSTNVMEGLS